MEPASRDLGICRGGRHSDCGRGSSYCSSRNVSSKDSTHFERIPKIQVDVEKTQLASKILDGGFIISNSSVLGLRRGELFCEVGNKDGGRMGLPCKANSGTVANEASNIQTM